MTDFSERLLSESSCTLYGARRSVIDSQPAVYGRESNAAKHQNRYSNTIASKIPLIIPNTRLAALTAGLRGNGLPQCGHACASVLISLPHSGHSLIIVLAVIWILFPMMAHPSMHLSGIYRNRIVRNACSLDARRSAAALSGLRHHRG